MGGIVAFNNTTLTITNTTISHGGDASGGPTSTPAQIDCLACHLTLTRTIVRNGVSAASASAGRRP